MQKASPSTRTAIIIFDSDAKLVVPLTPLSEQQTDTVLSGLDQVDYRGLLTNIPAAVERAIYELKLNSRTNAAKSIILLTDGIIDTGDPNKDSEVGSWLRKELATDAAQNEIKLFGIALTAEVDFRLLQSLALATKGDYFRAGQAEELPRVFERIHGVIGQPTSDQSSPNPESLSQPQPPKEIPSFITLEVMDPKHPAADSAASLSSSDASAEPDAAPPIEEKPAIQSPPQGSDRRATLFVLAGVSILAAAIWVLVWRRKRSVVALPISNHAPVPSLAPVPSAYLRDVNSVTGKKHHSLSHPVTVIGRVEPDPVENANKIVIGNPAISRRHALIEYKQHSFWITDQKSGNGTFVNGRRISEETRLRHGDRIDFHDMQFQFELAALDGAEETCVMNTSLSTKGAVITKVR